MAHRRLARHASPPPAPLTPAAPFVPPPPASVPNVVEIEAEYTESVRLEAAENQADSTGEHPSLNADADAATVRPSSSKQRVAPRVAS